MTEYEKIAIALSTIAILIPIIQWAWKKWVVKAILSFHPTGRIMLFFNQSGSYVRFDGVYEAERKPITVKNISLKITREKDERIHNLSWSSFISPVNQNITGKFVQTTESAHPFRIEADSVMCAFTEFGDPFDSFGKAFRNKTEALFAKIPTIQKQARDYAVAMRIYQSLPEYSEAKQLLEKEYLWEIGKYKLDLCVCFKNKEKHFKYTITVGEHESQKLKGNIDEALLSALKQFYSVPLNYYKGL